MGGEVTLGVVPGVRVLAAPLAARGGQFVGGQGAGPRGKTEREEFQNYSPVVKITQYIKER